MSKRKKSTTIIILSLSVLAFAVVCFFVFATYEVYAASNTQILTTLPDGKQFTITSVGFGSQNISTDYNRFFTGKKIYNPSVLANTIAILANDTNVPVKNYGITITGTTVSVDKNQTEGITLDEQDAYTKLIHGFENHAQTVTLITNSIDPTVTLDSAEQAATNAQSILTTPLYTIYNNNQIIIPATTIATWITATPDNSDLTLGYDQALMTNDLKNLTAPFDTLPKEMTFAESNDIVTDFTPPSDGTAINSLLSIVSITGSLNLRIPTMTSTNQSPTSTNPIPNLLLTLPAKGTGAQPVLLSLDAAHPPVPAEAAALGIQTAIGTATTTFTGSTKDRIDNILVGAKKLNGILVAPNTEFSTVKNLGDVDAAAGYVPELSIIGDQTIPEYGGGLCQIATTLFRSALNTGLPITARQNHSYRVSYYEKDGNNNYIGPGLDATIYDPSPDLRFLNDTGHWILVTNNISGIRITFTMYGTSDGRTEKIDGPTLLSSVPSGDPIYTPTDKLPVGTTQKTETAHPGGTAIATYTVQYANGTTKQQVFHSVYRPWPARYLVGTGTTTAVDPTQLAPQD